MVFSIENQPIGVDFRGYFFALVYQVGRMV